MYIYSELQLSVDPEVINRFIHFFLFRFMFQIPSNVWSLYLNPSSFLHHSDIIEFLGWIDIKKNNGNHYMLVFYITLLLSYRKITTVESLYGIISAQISEVDLLNGTDAI